MSEFTVDAGCHGAPAEVRRLYMGLKCPTDWMVVPVMARPVDDERPAGQLEADGEEEKCSPAVTHLVKQHDNTADTCGTFNYCQ